MKNNWPSPTLTIYGNNNIGNDITDILYMLINTENDANKNTNNSEDIIDVKHFIKSYIMKQINYME
jgi:hypothetical protein